MSKYESLALDILERHSAVVRNNHFVYTGGDHGSAYVNKTAVTPHARDMHFLCGYLCKEALYLKPDIVLGAVVVGAIMAQEVAFAFVRNTFDECMPRALFADKEGDQLVIKRGFDKYFKGARVLIVEDIVNTGKTVKALVALAQKYGGIVVGVSAICNCGPTTASDLGEGIVFNPLVTMQTDVFPENDCPFCRVGIPVNTELGHGAAFVARTKNN